MANDPRPPTRQDLAEFLPNQRLIRAFERLFDLVPSEFINLLNQIDGAVNIAGLAQAVSNRNLAAIQSLDYRSKGFVFVSGLQDLPLDVGGAISLEANYTYFFTKTVDLEGRRLVGGVNTTILGGSSENCRIRSTGLVLGTALISSAYTMPIRHITLESATVLNLDASGIPDQALDWYGVNIASTEDIGTIKGYSNFIGYGMAILNARGLVFDGSVGTVAFSASIFTSFSAGTVISIPATATVTRRARFINSAFVVTAPSVALDVSTSAAVPDEGYILKDCNFSGGGTYVSGVQHDDNKARWEGNRGITNSASLASYYMQSNGVATTILATSTPVKVSGTTTAGSISQRFTATSNRATYTGAISRNFKVTAVFSATSGNNNQLGFYIAKNGVVISESGSPITANSSGRLESGSCQTLTALVDTDYIEIFTENNTAITDITVSELSVILTEAA